MGTSLPRRNVVFLAPGNPDLLISPDFIGAPKDYLDLGIGSCEKNWEGIQDEFRACRDSEEFISACDRVQGYYAIDGWTKTILPVTSFPSDELLDASQYAELFFVLGRGNAAAYASDPENESLLASPPEAPLLFVVKDPFGEDDVLLEDNNGPKGVLYPDPVTCTEEEWFTHIRSEWFAERNAGKTFQDALKSPRDVVWWRCAYMHEWTARLDNRLRARKPCPICARGLLLPGVNDLLTVNPELAREWHDEKNAPMMPNMIAANSGKKVWWLCPDCGHEWKAKVGSRNSGTKCPVCMQLSRGGVRQSLATKYPHIADEWDKEANGALTPDMIAPASTKKVFWVCKRGHKWASKVDSRTRHDSPCPVCARLSRTGVYHSLETDFPDLAKEWHPTKNGDTRPDDISPTTNRHYWWKCHKCGNEWETRVDVRTRSGLPGCNKCKKPKKENN